MYNPHLIEALAAARRAEMLAAAEQARLARQAREARASRPRTTPARRRTPTGWRTAVRAFRARVQGAGLNTGRARSRELRRDCGPPVR